MQFKNRKELKILIVGIKWPPETFIERLILGLLSKGFKISICSKVRSNLRGIQWIPPMFLKVLHVKKWDLVYFPWNSAAIENQSVFGKSVPVVISCRGAQVNVAPHNPARVLMRSGLKISFEKAAAVHCVSNAIKREAEHFGLNPSKAVVITPAVDPDYFYPLSDIKKRNPTIKIITTGSLIWRKGLEYALMAMKILKAEGIPCQMEIVGEGSDRDRVLYTVDDLGLNGQVKLLGRQPPTAVRDLLQRADIFLLSSLSEGISNAVLEAMSCGLPVVTTDCGGMSEAITDGVEGFIVPVRNPPAMAEKIKILAGSHELRTAMSAAGRERILRQFRLEDQIDKFSGLFESLCQR